MNSTRCWLSLLLVAAVALVHAPAPVAAHCGVCVVQAYRLDCQTVYEEREVTAYRLEAETILEERQVTRMVPVWETQQRERRYTVTRPVMETNIREERYTVQRPVYETQMRDASYDRVRNVVETSEREERYIVQRQVWETAEREERFTVMRPVTETIEQEQRVTVMRPVVHHETRYVDQGCFVDQVSLVQPPVERRGLVWMPAAQVVNGKEESPPEAGGHHSVLPLSRQPGLDQDRIQRTIRLYAERVAPGVRDLLG
jgi:hypothetical protein